MAKTSLSKWPPSEGQRAVVTFVYLLGCALAWSYTVDDAFIVGRLAAGVASGNAVRDSDGFLVDGVTGLLWYLPGVCGELAGIDAVVTAKLVGILLGAILVHRLAAVLSVPWAIALVFAPGFIAWSVAGLETMAAALLVSIAVAPATQRDERPCDARRLWVRTVAAIALPWLRPELTPLALLAPGVFVATSSLKRAWGLVAVLAVVLSVAGTGAFRAAVFGHVLPLAFYAKEGSLSHGFRYVALHLLWATCGLGLVAVAPGARRFPGQALLVVVGLLAVAVAGGDWMPSGRLLVPLWPILFTLMSLSTRDSPQTWKRWSLLQALVLLVSFASALPEMRRSERSRAAVEPLRTELRRAERVALVDAGYLLYGHSGRALDLAGLTSERIAFRPGDYLDKEITASDIERAHPDLIVFHAEPRLSRAGCGATETHSVGWPAFAVERRLVALPYVQQNYEPHWRCSVHSGYEYWVLRRVGWYGR